MRFYLQSEQRFSRPSDYLSKKPSKPSPKSKPTSKAKESSGRFKRSALSVVTEEGKESGRVVPRGMGPKKAGSGKARSKKVVPNSRRATAQDGCVVAKGKNGSDFSVSEPVSNSNSNSNFNPSPTPAKEENSCVRFVDISDSDAGQRIDNYLLAKLKGVPKSRIYRILRKGEVRVNGSRVKAEYRLQANDRVRIPPVRVAERPPLAGPGIKLQALLESSVLYEDEHLLVLNKPSGLAVHGGSGASLGVIESFRAMRPKNAFLELVHRIDKETSGCLMLAKKRTTLNFLQNQLRSGTVGKVYQLLAVGRWPKGVRRVDAPLRKIELASGDRFVKVDASGKASVTNFQVIERFKEYTFLEATLETGRTHQIRVHSQFVGNPLAGDLKYGEDDSVQPLRKLGLQRMFLHAAKLTVLHPEGQQLAIESPLPAELDQVLQNIRV